MHISSAAFLLLLVPATRAAAIPNQEDLNVIDAVPNTVGEIPNTIIDSLLGQLAIARRDEAANLRGPKLVEEVSKGAVNTVSDLAISEGEALSPESAKNVVKIPFNGVVGQSDNILKKSIRQEERDDTESQLREYITQAFPELDAAHAELLLAELLAATKSNSPKAIRDTFGGVAGAMDAIAGLEAAVGTGGLSDGLVEDEDSIDAAAAALLSLNHPSHQSRDGGKGAETPNFEYIEHIEALVDSLAPAAPPTEALER